MSHMCGHVTITIDWRDLYTVSLFTTTKTRRNVQPFCQEYVFNIVILSSVSLQQFSEKSKRKKKSDAFVSFHVVAQ